MNTKPEYKKSFTYDDINIPEIKSSLEEIKTISHNICYKMIIEADNYKLLYYKKHRITARNGIGFLPDDIEDINDLMK